MCFQSFVERIDSNPAHTSAAVPVPRPPSEPSRRSIPSSAIRRLVHATPIERVAHLTITLATIALLTGCVDEPFIPDIEPPARVVTWWDPVECGEPHRVVVELEDDLGVPYSRSAPCEVGSITLDVGQWGVYRGRVYAWNVGPEIRSVLSVRLDVDAPVVQWYVDTPR